MTMAPIALRDIRSFHVGGGVTCLEGQPVQTVRVSPDSAPRSVDLNGHYITGQLYAQEFLLDAPRKSHPILFWHGGAMTGATWETTPDGRPGWTSDFLRRGYNVTVSDAVERGRASWSPFPQIYPASPLFRTQEDAWTLFRMGPREGFAPVAEKRRGYPGQQFPLEQFDQLCAQFVPRWTTNTAASVAAYRALLQHYETPVVIVAHSQGGWFAQRAASLSPNRIAAVVLIEPAGAPSLTEAEVAAEARIPHLYVWGDFCDVHSAWQCYKADAVTHSEKLRTAGGDAAHIDLPRQGIHGNSHMPMMDRNSAEVAALVANWLSDHGL
jgi:pimeloyl-ACP methyl ester carboxylesterase